MSLNKEQILSKKDLPLKEVEIPEWGGSVFVKTMNGQERDSFELSVIDEKHKGKMNLENIRAKLCAVCLCDENGERLFSDKEVFALSKKSASALSKIFQVAQELNGLSPESVEQIKEDFLPDQVEGSTSV